MSLIEFADNSITDKNTVHAYLPLYQKLLQKKRYSAKNVLEVGVCHGGSINMWYNFFPNAKIYGVDINDDNIDKERLIKDDRIHLYLANDAYDPKFVQENFQDIKFDFVIDDGPHSLEGQKQFINLYTPLLADDGILIVEDIQRWEWLPELVKEVPSHLQYNLKLYDLRNIKNRWDDVVLVIDKSDN